MKIQECIEAIRQEQLIPLFGIHQEIDDPTEEDVLEYLNQYCDEYKICSSLLNDLRSLKSLEE